MDGKAVTFEEPHIVSREKWKAERPKKAQATKNFPLSYLVLMHTNTPVCKTKKECKETLRQLQKKHMDEGAPDILHKTKDIVRSRKLCSTNYCINQQQNDSGGATSCHTSVALVSNDGSVGLGRICQSNLVITGYLISQDGTVYEGRSPNIVGMTYSDDDETLGKANNNSINVAYIDNHKDSLNRVKLRSAVTNLAAKLIRDKIINQDVDIIWFDQNKKKKKQPLPERIEKHRLTNGNGNKYNPPTDIHVTKSKNKRESKKTINDMRDTVVRVDKQGPFILEPHHFGMLIDSSSLFGEEEDERVMFF